MVTIRKAEACAHAAQLFALLVQNGDDAGHARAVLAEGAADLWLAEADGRPVGALLARPMRSSDGALRGGVDNLLVDARHRRRGIGRRLMAAEAHFRARGLTGMELATSPDNLAARALYDSFGYRVVERYTRTRRLPAGEELAEPRLRLRRPFEAGAQG